MSRWALLCTLGLVCAGLLGCGEDESSPAADNPALEAARAPNADLFPPAAGRSLQQLADTARPGAQLAPATSRYVVGENRLAFGLLDQQQRFLYAPTAVYVGEDPNSAAQGPFLAPADSLITEPAFRSKQAALEGDVIASIYSTEIPLARAGKHSLLVLSSVGGELLGATAELEALADDPIPAPGEPAPARVQTETLAEAGDPELIETREPADQMHGSDFAELLGERPVALLFASPALCESRVCGPVTDIAAQLQEEYGDRVEFIHQEPYVDNDLRKGVREPLRAFNLQTEPWLFTFNAEGRVAARLEGSFGIAAFEEAVLAALGGGGQS